jgi:putative serine protease PepD
VAGATIVALLGCSLSANILREQVQPTPTVEAQPTPQEPDQPAPVRVVTATPEPLTEQEAYDAAEASTIRVYERVSPAVVHIKSQVTTMDFFGGLYPAEGTGSGFIIDKEGHIVTNNHVVEGAENVEVTLFDKTVTKAEIVGLDPLNDLAVIRIKVDADKLHPVDMSFSEQLKVGQRAIAIGNPYGLDWTLTAGVISALGRSLQISQDRIMYDVIQTDAAINPGNSGGPLLNSHGQLIGVNSAMRQGAQNIGFAIPLSTVRRVVPELIQNGRYRHAWLGLAGYSLFPELSQRLELPVEKGILIAQVVANGPAAQAGLRGANREAVLGNTRLYVGGDILVEIDGVAIDSNEALREFLETRTRVSQQVEVKFYRGDKVMTARATLSEREQ